MNKREAIKHLERKNIQVYENKFEVTLSLDNGIIEVFEDEVIIDLNDITHLTIKDLQAIIAISKELV